MTRDSVSQDTTGLLLADREDPGQHRRHLHPVAALAEGPGVRAAAKAAGKNITLFGSDGLFDPSTWKITGSYDSFFPVDTNARVVKAYAAAHGGDGEYFGAPTYAATQVVVGAITKACEDGKATRAEVRKHIATDEHPGRPVGARASGSSSRRTASSGTAGSASSRSRPTARTSASGSARLRSRHDVRPITGGPHARLMRGLRAWAMSSEPPEPAHQPRRPGSHPGLLDGLRRLLLADAGLDVLLPAHGQRDHPRERLRADRARLHDGLRDPEAPQLRPRRRVHDRRVHRLRRPDPARRARSTRRSRDRRVLIVLCMFVGCDARLAASSASRSSASPTGRCATRRGSRR